MKNLVLILDFGSKFTHLIAKSVRLQNVYYEVIPYNTSAQEIKKKSPSGLIFSGSPYSIMDKNAPECDEKIFDLSIPILGICYGMQVITDMLGGVVKHATKKEYGYNEIKIVRKNILLQGFSNNEIIWMSHSDFVEKTPEGFKVIACSKNTPISAMQNEDARIYAVQFHPEVTHTEKVLKLFRNFLFKICIIKSECMQD
ncbi:MAG: glutamine-hydrolyzing GMP synthase [Candidatus Cloacimonadota bacterium]|nr:glutamine-hydrolyzing GMP synthase [Candidatus Cloacimonadota bacterium]